MSDEEPKSAYELAMARLEKRDKDDGVTRRPLSDAQREKIAEIRRNCEAKLAEREIFHRDALARLADPSARAKLEEEYRNERDVLTRERDEKIERAREAE